MISAPSRLPLLSPLSLAARRCGTRTAAQPRPTFRSRRSRTPRSRIRTIRRRNSASTSRASSSVFPLTRAHLMRITPENIAKLSQEQIDQIYGRLTAGPIPDGPYRRRSVLRARRRISHATDTRLEEISAVWKDASPAPASTRWRLSAATCGRARCSIATERIAAQHDREHWRRALSDRWSTTSTPCMTTTIPRQRSAGRRFSATKTSGCCFRPSSIADRACSTRGASRSSSITITATRSRATAQARQPRRPRRLAHPRRDPHDPARLLSRARLRQPACSCSTSRRSRRPRPQVRPPWRRLQRNLSPICTGVFSSRASRALPA